MCNGPFTAIFYSVICKCPNSVVTLRQYLHSHLCTAQCERCLPDLSFLVDLDVHANGTLY